MNEQEYKEAAEYWKHKECVAMPAEELREFVEDFLAEKHVCALATGADGFVRCTPLEYSYHDGRVWIFTEGGEKFIGLAKNSNVCLAVYDQDPAFGSLRSVQLMGRAELVEPMSEVYVAHAEYKKVPVSALQKLADDGHPMRLLRIQPTHLDVLCSKFKEQGFTSRQELEWDAQ